MEEKEMITPEKKMDTTKIALIGMGITINVVASFVAVNFKLPIYLDSIGTVLIACLLGPKYGVLTGVLGSMTSGILFDIYSLYFAPVQISTGYISGIMYQKGWLKGKKQPLGVLAFALPTAILSAMIATWVFGGVTSAGSSYIVQILSKMGISMEIGVFATQIWTEYLDKYIAVIVAISALLVLPNTLKRRIIKAN